MAKVLLDEIERTRAQPVRLQMVLARRAESRMGQYEARERLWKAYQTARIESSKFFRRCKIYSG